MVVRTWREDPCTMIRAVGDVDVLGAPRLLAEIDQALAAHDPPHLILDLTEVPFCDSVGLGVLVGTLKRVRRAQGRLILVLTPGMITHLLDITNLDRHFETYTSVEDARTALGAAA